MVRSGVAAGGVGGVSGSGSVRKENELAKVAMLYI